MKTNVLLVLAATLALASCNGAAAPPTPGPTEAAPNPSTPTTTAAAPTPAPTPGPTTAPTAAHGDAATIQARNAVEELDRLAALGDPSTEQLVEWFRSVSTDIRSYGVPALEAYFAAQEELFLAIQNGQSARQPIADLLALRNSIAALVGIAAATPRATAPPTAQPDPADYQAPSAADWTALVADPEAFAGQKYVVAVCRDGQASLTTLIGTAWYVWRQDYWEGTPAAFEADEDVIMAIFQGKGRLTAYVTVLGWYPNLTGDDEPAPHFQLDFYDASHDCME